MNASILFAGLLLGQAPGESSAVIDRELAARWHTEKLTPAGKTSDHEFLRRVSLDLIGRIPTMAEQEAFRKDPPALRRRLLVDRLLSHEDYARHWSNVWGDWLLGSAAAPKVRDEFHGWLEEHFAENGSHKVLAENLLTAKGSTRLNPAGHFLVVHRGQLLPEKDALRYGQYDMVPLTGHVLRVFHGCRLQCVQCHDHPYDDNMLQSHFFGINALFRQVEFTHKNGRDEIGDNPKLNPGGIVFYERRNTVWLGTDSHFFDAKLPRNFKGTRRAFLAERLVQHREFARAHVNFVWTHLFGGSLTTSAVFDDMGPHNPVVHEKLLDRLAAEFVKSGHDPKALLRAICLSDAYGLQSIANKTNDSAESSVFFSRMQTRPLTRHQLAESYAVVVAGEDYFKSRDTLRKEFLRGLGGLPARYLTHCDIEPLNTDRDLSYEKVLLPIANDDFDNALTRSTALANVFKRHGPPSLATLEKIVPELYQITLCRPPTPQEMKRLMAIASNDPRVRGQAVPPPQYWVNFTTDLFWAQLNCNEFALNH